MVERLRFSAWKEILVRSETHEDLTWLFLNPCKKSNEFSSWLVGPKSLGANRSILLSEYCEKYLVDCERDTCGLFLQTLLNLSLPEH